MTPEQIEAQEAKRKGKPAKPQAGGKGKARDLNDPAQQEEVLRPKPSPLTIGGQEARLFPLPAYEQRSLVYSFMPKLVRAARERGDILLDPETEPERYRNAIIGRYAQTLVEEKPLMRELAHYIARSESAPGADIDEEDEAIEARAKFIFRELLPREMVTMFTLISVLNEVFGAAENPRTEQPSTTS